MFNVLHCIFEKLILLEVCHSLGILFHIAKPCDIAWAGPGEGRDIRSRGSDSCEQGRKQGEIEQKRVQLGRKTKGPGRLACPTHFPEEKLALRTKEDYFAYRILCLAFELGPL